MRRWALLTAGVAGVLVGRALPRSEPSASRVERAAIVSPAPPPAECKVERTALASVRTQLAICMAYSTTSLSSATPASATSTARALPGSTDEARENRRLLDSYPEAVIVRHTDGHVGVHRPEDWPDDGDGQILARKRPDGQVAWYAGPDAGPRSDPAAFQVPEPLPDSPPMVGRLPDGTVTINGHPFVFQMPDAGAR